MEAAFASSRSRSHPRPGSASLFSPHFGTGLRRCRARAQGTARRAARPASPATGRPRRPDAAAPVAVQAPPVALDPEGREAAFSYVGAGDARPVFRLEVNRVGVINVDCELEMHPAALLVGGEPVEFAPGATVKGSFRCSISPEERRRIAEVDLAHADTADAEAFYNRNPPEPRRLRGAYERIPDASRPNLAVAASFGILNA